jgi:hypothetical protein
MLLRRFLPRFLPNMEVVSAWNLGSIPLDLTLCPTRQLNKNCKVILQTGEAIYLGSPWLDSAQLSIVLVDPSYFSRHNFNPNDSFPVTKVFKGLNGENPFDAIVKPTHLRVLSSKITGLQILKLKHPMYGILSFENVFCSLNSFLEEDILLVPDSFWDLFCFNSFWLELN